MKVAIMHISAETFAGVLKSILSGEVIPPIPVNVSEFGDFSLFTETKSSPYEIHIRDKKDWTAKEGVVGIDLDNMSDMSILIWEGEKYRIKRMTFSAPGYGVYTLPFPRIKVPTELSETERVVSSFYLRQLQNLKFVIVGVSRTGFWIANGLANWQVNRLTLIDPDSFEPRHTDTIPLGYDDFGRFKVEVAEKYIKSQHFNQININVINKSIFNVPLREIAQADIIISALDNAGARLFVDALSQSFNLLWIDTGVEIQEEMVGGKVRIFWPSGPRFRNVEKDALTIKDWSLLYKRETPSTSPERKTLAPAHIITANYTLLSLIKAIRGEVTGGEILWYWGEDVSAQWKAYDNEVSQKPDLFGKGLNGITEYKKWLTYVFGNGQDIMNAL